VSTAEQRVDEMAHNVVGVTSVHMISLPTRIYLELASVASAALTQLIALKLYNEKKNQENCLIYVCIMQNVQPTSIFNFNKYYCHYHLVAQ
jgi:hypothetical protein